VCRGEQRLIVFLPARTIAPLKLIGIKGCIACFIIRLSGAQQGKEKNQKDEERKAIHKN
jgi:hypothetical protein